VTRATGAVSAAAGVISVFTVLSRLDVLPARTLASTPESLHDGHLWLLASSAAVADRPALASIIGFLVVGLAAVTLCGGRAVVLTAALGHICSAVIVYAAIDLAQSVDPAAFENVARYPDYGTSAIIAAWIGAIAYQLWRRERRTAAVVLPVLAALIGWFLEGTLNVLDAEHGVALACGIAAMWALSVHAARPSAESRFVLTQ
jgi:hypothetical protein